MRRIYYIRRRIEKDLKVDLNNRSRSREHTYARAMFFKLSRDHTEATLSELADEVGIKTHASVLRALNYTMDDLKFEKKYRVYYENLHRELSGKPSLQVENEKLSIKVKELEFLLKSYRDGAIR